MNFCFCYQMRVQTLCPTFFNELFQSKLPSDCPESFLVAEKTFTSKKYDRLTRNVRFMTFTLPLMQASQNSGLHIR